MKLSLIAPAIAAIAFTATGALAQTATPNPPAAPLGTARPALDLKSEPAKSSFALDLTPRTALDRRLGSDDVVGSLGYLCGLQPRPDDNRGVGSSFGPVGTFLGAKLTMAFR